MAGHDEAMPRCTLLLGMPAHGTALELMDCSPCRLPVTEIREALVAALQQHDVAVVSGETGSGKTTQASQAGEPGRRGNCHARVSSWMPSHPAVPLRLASELPPRSALTVAQA